MTERFLYPIPEVAFFLGGISKRKVYDLIKAGQLSIVKIGRRSFVPRKSLEKFIQKLED